MIDIITENKVHPVRVAIIDLYDNIVNEGMRCIKEIVLEANNRHYQTGVSYAVHEARYRADIPDLSYDIYISTGGPGSPLDGAGTAWEKKYFDWWQAVWDNNQNPYRPKKFVFAVCHSFQMMARFFQLAAVTKRRSKSFGVMPSYKTAAGEHERLLQDLPNPFYAADFRDWQVVNADRRRIKELDASILCREKIRPHVPLERSITGIRLSDEIVGFQFHPEADAESMLYHARKPERRHEIIKKYGIEKYHQFLCRLEEPGYIDRTREIIMPRFLDEAISRLRPYRDEEPDESWL